MGRRRGLLLLLLSTAFLLLGYLLGGLLIELNQRNDNQLPYIRKEYIYSLVYGALFYTALVTLVRRSYTPETCFVSRNAPVCFRSLS
jgi:Na+-driven multidrug efflux pump